MLPLSMAFAADFVIIPQPFPFVKSFLKTFFIFFDFLVFPRWLCHYITNLRACQAFFLFFSVFFHLVGRFCSFRSLFFCMTRPRFGKTLLDCSPFFLLIFLFLKNSCFLEFFMI